MTRTIDKVLATVPPQMVDICIHYGGKFQISESREYLYVGGDEVLLCSVNTDDFTYITLMDYVHDTLGYKNLSGMSYRMPGGTRSQGIMNLNTTDQLMDAFDLCDSGTVLDIYLEHLGDDESEHFSDGENMNEVEPNDDVNEPEGNASDQGQERDGSDPSEPQQTEKGVENEAEDDNEVATDAETDVEGIDEERLDISDATDEEIEEARHRRASYDKVKKPVDPPTEVHNGGQSVPMTSVTKKVIAEPFVYDNDEEDVPEFMLSDRDSSDPDTGPESDKEDELFLGEDVGLPDQGRKYRRYKAPSDPNLIEFELGLEFSSTKEFKEAILGYSLAKRKDLGFHRNEKRAVSFVCHSSKACRWRIWMGWSKSRNIYRITSFNPKHRCGKNFKNRLMTSKWIARKYFHRFRSNPNWKLVDIKAEIFQTYEVSVGKKKCLRAKNLALADLIGSMADHYAKLWDYKEELDKRNPGSTFELCYTKSNIKAPCYFKRFYICFDALRRGFLEGCRHCIGLDGCFLKGVQKGQLLTCVGRDANDQMFPVAWAIVQVENRDNWQWFLQHLIEDLDMLEGGRGWTLITDQQKGLIPAIKELLPNSEHRKCARHIYANWHKDHKGGQLRKMFWQIAKSTTFEQMVKNFEELKKIDRNAHDDLVKQDPIHWCRAYFNTYCKVSNVDNNLAEAWNWSIVGFRAKPVIYMLEDIRKDLMERVHKRRDWMLKRECVLCPRIVKKIETIQDKVKDWRVLAGCANLFEVSQHKDSFIVDTDQHSCTCRLWQLSGLPCQHALSVVNDIGEDPENFVSDYYKRDAFLGAYSHFLNPLCGENQWVHVDKEPLLPPPFTRMPGRPKKKRTREAGESTKKKTITQLAMNGKVMACSICKKEGHNKRRCPQRSQNESEAGPTITKKRKTQSNAKTTPTKRIYSKCRNKGHKTKPTQTTTVQQVGSSQGMEVNSQRSQVLDGTHSQKR